MFFIYKIINNLGKIESENLLCFYNIMWIVMYLDKVLFIIIENLKF